MTTRLVVFCGCSAVFTVIGILVVFYINTAFLTGRVEFTSQDTNLMKDAVIEKMDFIAVFLLWGSEVTVKMILSDLSI